MTKSESLEVSPGPDRRSVRTASGEVIRVPAGWSLLPPGDAGLTRRVKSLGPTWTVKEKKGRRLFSKGVWAPKTQIESAQKSVAEDRAKPSYAKRLQADAARRETKQLAYQDEFKQAVLDFLAFDPRYKNASNKMADAITAHATPVGSGTVARTQRISLARRAESAVIAWMRHQTTCYDEMKIQRVKGKRREVRRELAAQSRKLLAKYRKNEACNVERCPLWQAIENLG